MYLQQKLIKLLVKILYFKQFVDRCILTVQQSVHLLTFLSKETPHSLPTILPASVTR